MTLFDQLKQEQAPTLYHYTSLDTFVKIVEHRKLWAGNIHYMNDVEEFKSAIKIIVKLIEQRITPSKATKRESDFCKAVDDRLKIIGLPRVYICCFSARDDVLSQWRGYCPGGVGISFGLSPATLKDIARRQGFYLARCVYEPEEQKQLMSELLEKHIALLGQGNLDKEQDESYSIAQQARAFIDEFTTQAPLIKHPSFEEEAEWRLVSHGPIEANNEHIGIRSKASTLVPYYKVVLTKPKTEIVEFASIRIGPTQDEALAIEALAILLNRYEENIRVSKKEIRTSRIPYRNW